MKLSILVIILWASFASAAPFLVAEPPPVNEQIIYYKVYKNAVLEGTFIGETLGYDLVGITPGAYDWTAEACNVWGCSLLSDPYISPDAAGKPMNLQLAP